MAYIPTGKIVLNSVSPTTSKVTENLGYTHANLFVTGGSSYATLIKRYGQRVNFLTTNTYDRTVINYEVELDTYEE